MIGEMLTFVGRRDTKRVTFRLTRLDIFSKPLVNSDCDHNCPPTPNQDPGLWRDGGGNEPSTLHVKTPSDR